MVYCSAVDCKSNSSRRKEDRYIYIYIYILVFMVFRAIVIKKETLSALKRATLPKEESLKVCHLHLMKIVLKEI